MEREHRIYMVREHSNRSGKRTLYPVAKIKNYRSDKGTKEIKIYNANVRPQKHAYGKYGTLAKKNLEDKGIDWTIADLPGYLHGVDKAAERLYDDMWNKLSVCEQYRRTGNYLEDVKRINAMKQIIEEEILNEIVYV